MLRIGISPIVHGTVINDSSPVKQQNIYAKYLCLHTHVLHCLLMYFHIIIFYLLSKKYLTWIPHKHKVFWQLRLLDDFSINIIRNIFERLKIPEKYSQTS